MNWAVVQRILGLLLMMFSITMLPPILFSLYYDDNSWLPFVEGFVLTLAAGFICWAPVHRTRKELRLRDGFLVVASFWTVLGAFGAAPLYFADALSLSLTDAVFESVSGLTTTGATVLTGLDELPRSLLYYRQQLQWLGGMGIIVLAVAVLPMLGVGGMQLYRAETPGPVKDTKLTPRITETAKALWYVYLAFTICCMLGYKIAGMDWFDALCHAFSTVAIGGFSPHDMSIGYFDSAAIDIVAIFFMFAAGINFSLHFYAWRYVSVKHYSQDPEFRAYTSMLVVLVYHCCPCPVRLSRLHRDRPDFHRRRVPGCLDRHHDRLYHNQLLGLAGGVTRAAGVCEFCRRLGGINRWRHQGHPLPAGLQAGRSRNRSPGAPERGDSRQTG